MENQNFDLTLELQLEEQLRGLDKLIENLKLRSIVQALGINGSKSVSPEEIKLNGEACLKIRNSISDALKVLKDIKNDPTDNLSPLGKMRVDQMIQRCEENIAGFDRVRDAMGIVDKSKLEEMGLDKIVVMEQMIIRHKDLNDLLHNYTQYILSSKFNPDFEIASDRYVYNLINRIKARRADLEQCIEKSKELFGSESAGLISTKILADADALINRFDSQISGVQSDEQC